MTIACFNQFKNKRYYSLFITIFPIIVLTQSCSNTSAISDESKNITLPEQWHTEISEIKISPENNEQFDLWVIDFEDEQLISTIKTALANNHDLQSQAINVSLAKERLAVSNASDYPELSLSANNTRRKTLTQNAETYQTTANLRLNLSYEVDIWGQLSDKQQQQQLTYASAKSEYEHQKLTLVTNVIKRWYSLVEAKKLLSLYRERAQNLNKNLEMIKSSYQLGLGEALDVYLTKNSVNRELERVAEQKQKVKEAARTLELLLGDYPKGVLAVESTFPKINTQFYIDKPTELLTRRNDIASSWFELLALDAGLAVAHKQRFPKLSLSGTYGDADSKLSDLFSGNPLTWSLIGNLTAPIFNGGALSSLEEQARLEVVKKEQQYLSQVFSAFEQVENLMSNRESLIERLNYSTQAQVNALEAQKLSFNQYMRGLVTYTTVLESERRAFDAQTTLIQITNQLLQNRADSYLALGGGLESTLLTDEDHRSNAQEQ